jgi:hypothetical protein
MKVSFYVEFECVFDKVSKYHMKTVLDFIVKVGWEDFFKLTTGNEGLHKICMRMELEQ